MRVLFTASNARGHYYCMVPLGWALQAAGHEVRVACPPAESVHVGRAGLVPVPVLDGPDLNRWAMLTRYQEAVAGDGGPCGPPLHPFTGEPVADLAEFDIERESARFMADCVTALERSFDAAVEFGRSWAPDLVVHDLMTPEGALVARLGGVPAVYHSLGLFGAAETEPGVDLGLEDPSESFARHGAEPWHRSQIEHVLDPSPESALPPHGSARRLAVRYIPYNGPGAVPDWLARRPRGGRICLLWGYSASIMYGLDVPTLRYAVEAAVATGAEVVLTASPQQAGALGELPGSVRVLQGFPVHLLLEHSDLVIHHGGANSLMNAAAAGLPQLALTLSADHVVFGRRMARTGAVEMLAGLTAGPGEIASALDRVLTDSRYRSAARRLGAEIAAHPTPHELVPVLEKLAGAGPGTRKAGRG